VKDSVATPPSRLRWYREINRSQWFTLVGAWLLWSLDAVDFLLITFVLIDISKTFDVSLHTASLLILATFGVRWLGGMLFGNLSDRIGRKIPMLIALIWFTTGAALTGLAWNFAAVFAFRLLLGFGMAPILTLGSTMIAEVWPERHRAIGIGILVTGWGFGTVMAATIYGLMYTHFGWRPMFFVGIIPGILVGLFVWRFVPESPVWKKSREQAVGFKQTSPALLLFREHLGRVVILSICQFMLQFGSWPFQGLLATHLRELHMTPAAVSFVTSSGAIGQIFGFFCSGFIAERVGRRNAIALMLALGCVSVVGLMNLASVSMQLAAAFAFLCGFFIVGASGIYPTVLAENIPSNVRATGVGLMYNIGVIGGGIAPFVILMALDRFKVGLPQGIMTATLLADATGVLIIYLATRETRGISIEDAGKSSAAEQSAIQDGGIRRDAW
jgi:SHS family sialic acid transporter-like MFS transporter